MSGTVRVRRPIGFTQKQVEPGEKMTETLTIRLSASDVRRLNALADVTHRSAGSMVREALYEWLMREESIAH